MTIQGKNFFSSVTLFSFIYFIYRTLDNLTVSIKGISIKNGGEPTANRIRNRLIYIRYCKGPVCPGRGVCVLNWFVWKQLQFRSWIVIWVSSWSEVTSMFWKPIGREATCCFIVTLAIYLFLVDICLYHCWYNELPFHCAWKLSNQGWHKNM